MNSSLPSVIRGVLYFYLIVIAPFSALCFTVVFRSHHYSFRLSPLKVGRIFHETSSCSEDDNTISVNNDVKEQDRKSDFYSFLNPFVVSSQYGEEHAQIMDDEELSLHQDQADAIALVTNEIKARLQLEQEEDAQATIRLHHDKKEAKAKAATSKTNMQHKPHPLMGIVKYVTDKSQQKAKRALPQKADLEAMERQAEEQVMLHSIAKIESSAEGMVESSAFLKQAFERNIGEIEQIAEESNTEIVQQKLRETIANENGIDTFLFHKPSTSTTTSSINEDKKSAFSISSSSSTSIDIAPPSSANSRSSDAKLIEASGKFHHNSLQLSLDFIARIDHHYYFLSSQHNRSNRQWIKTIIRECCRRR